MNKGVLDEEFARIEETFQDDLRAFERLKSMLVDHIILSLILVLIIIIPFGIALLIENDLVGKVLMVLVFSAYINKDIFRGRSPAKRVFGQVVVHHRTKIPANELRCAIRNFTVILWPLECIVVAFSPNRRIGDFLAGTQVMRTSREEAKGIIQELKNLRNLSWLASLGVSVIYIAIVFQVIGSLLPIVGEMLIRYGS